MPGRFAVYDDYVYESDMTRGLLVWRLNDAAVAGARGESHSNPQTMYTSLAGAPANGGLGGAVPATLSLTIGASASFGAFTPGVARDYFATTSANVASTAGDALLSVADPSPNATGRLVNGSFALPQPLQARARNAANTGTAYNNLGSSASPLNLLSYSGPVSNDAVTLEFKQAIGANDALRTGNVQQDADVHPLNHEPVKPSSRGFASERRPPATRPALVVWAWSTPPDACSW